MFTQICFDTNALRSEGWPKKSSGEFQALVQLAVNLGIGLVICRPVLEELDKFWTEQVAQILASSAAATEKLRRIAENPELLDGLRIPKQKTLLQSFKSAVEQFISANKVEIPEMTSLSTRTFFEQANAKKPPFKEEGKGFKDAVIFSSYLEFLVERLKSSKVSAAFITEDRDFDGALEAEAASSGIHLKLFRTVAELRTDLQQELDDTERRRWERDQQRAKNAILRQMNEIAAFIEGNLEIPESELPWSFMTRVTLRGLTLVSVDSVATAFPNGARDPLAVPISVHMTVTITATLDRFATSEQQKRVHLGDTFGFPGFSLEVPTREVVTEQLQKKVVLEATGQTRDGDYVSIKPIRAYLPQSKFLGL